MSELVCFLEAETDGVDSAVLQVDVRLPEWHVRQEWSGPRGSLVETFLISET